MNSPRPRDSRANNWGQSKRYGPSWQENVPLTVLQLRDLPFWPSEVMNLTLAAEFLKTTPGRHDCRWVWLLRAGVGGASRLWQIDCKPLQQLSLSAETLEVAVVPKAMWVDQTYQDPLAELSFSAFISRGNTSTERSTYTEGVFALASAQSRTFKVPPGAASWRITSAFDPGSTLNPFVANVTMHTSLANFPIESYNLADLYPGVLAGAWMPLASGCDSLTIGNGTADTKSANVVWGLDL